MQRYELHNAYRCSSEQILALFCSGPHGLPSNWHSCLGVALAGFEPVRVTNALGLPTVVDMRNRRALWPAVASTVWTVGDDPGPEINLMDAVVHSANPMEPVGGEERRGGKTRRDEKRRDETRRHSTRRDEVHSQVAMTVSRRTLACYSATARPAFTGPGYNPKRGAGDTTNVTARH